MGTWLGIVDTIKNDESIGTAGIIGEVIGGGESIVDIWSDVKKMKNIGSTTSNGGLYSPTLFYSTIAKGYISASSQGFKSYEKYIEDGAWDLNDSGRSAVEIGMSGLYSRADVLTFGLISDKTTGVTADDISNGLETWASNVRKGVGDYILNDPEFLRSYNESGIIGQVAITFYAAFKCWL